MGELTTSSESEAVSAGLRNLAGLVAEAADRRGDHPAIVDPNRPVLTWTEADRRTGQMAAALIEVGVAPGDRVGVHFRKSAEAWMAMHAVVRIGAVAVPLDPTASADYLATICALTSSRVVLSHQACSATASALAEDPAAGVERLVSTDELVSLDPVPPIDEIDPDQPAYLITTSGSTGTPKSICHTHASALGHIRFALDGYDFTAHDRFADIAPNHFDISTLALWVAPVLGATNVVVPEPYQMLPASAAQLVEQERITVWYSVPYLLVQLHQRGGIDERDLSSLRHVLFGGEVFPPGVLADLMARLPDARFSNVYGPAEVNMCTLHHLTEPPGPDQPIPIGEPVTPVEVRLTDPEGQPQLVEQTPEPARGSLGEILVSGPATMAGYWERPDLNAECFVDEAKRWYRTGDLAWREPGGELVFAGRRDHQVKVRGHRVELESIEATIEDLDGVVFAVAAVAPGDGGGDVVIVGMKTDEGDVPSAADLRPLVVSHLPTYALPAAVLALDSTPQTGSGKLDRRSLRTMAVDRFVTEQYGRSQSEKTEREDRARGVEGV